MQLALLGSAAASTTCLFLEKWCLKIAKSRVMPLKRNQKTTRFVRMLVFHSNNLESTADLQTFQNLNLQPGGPKRALRSQLSQLKVMDEMLTSG